MVGRETVDDAPTSRDAADLGLRLALAVVWCVDTSRIGEVVFPTDAPQILGRGEAEHGEHEERAVLRRQRPGATEARPPLSLAALSRRQLSLTVSHDGDRISVGNLGRRKLLSPRGAACEEASLGPGDTCEIEGQLAFVCVARPTQIPVARGVAHATIAFGAEDSAGIVGESPAAWLLREHVAFVAARAAHVLVLGPSGAGKELVAQAVHGQSKRARKALVSRSAVTIPAGLADAELFGNLANYPNPGTPDRKGLVGEADGGTLFLDELGELPDEIQARLLRVLDERGEYQRLGEARVRRADLRLVAATNRPVSSLKHDVAARFRLRLTVPPLDERREDIPLIARHLLQRVAKTDPDIEQRFFDAAGAPRVSAGLMKALVGHTYRTHVRELDALLWLSLGSSQGDTLELTPTVRAELERTEEERPHRSPETLTEEDVRAALDRADGVQDRAFRDLGLANRFVLHRLMKKWKIAGRS